MLQLALPDRAFNLPGYLASLPYQAETSLELAQFAQQHLCPCCGNVISFSEAGSYRRRPDEKLVYTQVSACQCGFYVPFHCLSVDKDNSVSVIYLDENQVQSETAIFNACYLLHAGQYTGCIDNINAWLICLNENAWLYFYKAYALEKMKRYQQALNNYDRCLDIDPECTQAWHNKILILQKLKRDREANFHLVKYCRLQPVDTLTEITSQTEEVHPEVSILAREQGMFGPIEIGQTANLRYLNINDEREGDFWLDSHNEPSHVPSVEYISGWLPAADMSGADHKSVSGLMLGLGAGSGVIALLENFSCLRLTVVEIDPVLIKLACDYFPLLQHYVSQDRLHIVSADALEYIKTEAEASKPRFDFVLVDLYQGELAVSERFLTLSFVSQLKKVSSLVGINLLADADVSQVRQVFSSAGLPLKTCFCTGTNNLTDNFILFSKTLSGESTFVPYSGEKGYLSRSFARGFKHMLQHRTLLD